MKSYGFWLVVFVGLTQFPAAADAQVVVVSNSVQERGAAPGETYAGQIRLRNDGADAHEVRIYQTDYVFFADGRSEYGEPGAHTRSNARWMRVSPASLLVPAGGMAEVDYTVSVPADAAPQASGTYWSMIMVEPVPPAAAATEQRGVGLRTVVRFGIQVATHIAATSAAHGVHLGTPRVVVADDGARTLEVELANDGEMGYRPLVSLELYDASGALVAEREEQRGLLYPGTSTLQRLALGELPAGAYEALLVVDTGAPDLFGGQFRLTVGRER